MRTLRLIDHCSVERIVTINVRHICNLSIQKNHESSEVSRIEIFWGSGFSTIDLFNEKAYELYDKLASWLSNGSANLEVEMVKGMNGNAIDYTAVEK